MDRLSDLLFHRDNEVEMLSGGDLGGFQFVISPDATMPLITKLTSGLRHPAAPGLLPPQASCALWRDGGPHTFAIGDLRRRLWSAPVLRFSARGDGVATEFAIDALPVADANHVRAALMAPRAATVH